MHCETEIEEGFDAYIAETWHKKLLRQWVGASRITVSHVRDEVKKTGWAKIQKIDLDNRSAKTKPKDDITEVLEAIAKSMHQWMLLKIESGELEDDATCMFRIETGHVSGADTGRTAFFVRYNVSAQPPDEEDNIVSLEHQVMQDMLEMQSRQIDRQDVCIADMQDRFIQLVLLNAAPIEASGEFLRMGGQQLNTGMQALVQALTMNYNREHQETIEREKTKRWDKWAEKVGPYVPFAVAGLAQRFGFKMPEPPAPDSGQGSGGDDSSKDDSGGEEGSSGAEPEMTRDMVIDTIIERGSVLDMAQGFGATLASKQRIAFIEALSHNEWLAFEKLFAAESEKEALQRYRELKEALDMSVLGELQEKLDPKQVELLMAFLGKAASAEG